MASKSKRRRRVLGASCILAALIVAGSSFAWFTSKDEVTNRLSANADYGVSIVESFAPPENWVPGQEVNKDVYAVNTGNVAAFVEETVSGKLTITTEVAKDNISANSVKLTAAERYAVEAGSYLAYKPGTSNKELGVQVVSMIPDATKLEGYTTADAATDFTPDAAGLYVFRRSIGVDANTKVETFKYEAYYFDGHDYYKVTDLRVTPDGASYAGDNVTTDGNLTGATSKFVEEETKTINPTALTYDSDNNRLVASYYTGNAAADLTTLAQKYDNALVLYEDAVEEYKAALRDNTSADANVQAENAELQAALDALRAARNNLKTAQEALTAATNAKDAAMVELYGNKDGGETGKTTNPAGEANKYTANSLYGKSVKAQEDLDAAMVELYGNKAGGETALTTVDGGEAEKYTADSAYGKDVAAQDAVDAAKFTLYGNKDGGETALTTVDGGEANKYTANSKYGLWKAADKAKTDYETDPTTATARDAFLNYLAGQSFGGQNTVAGVTNYLNTDATYDQLYALGITNTSDVKYQYYKLCVDEKKAKEELEAAEGVLARAEADKELTAQKLADARTAVSNAQNTKNTADQAVNDAKSKLGTDSQTASDADDATLWQKYKKAQENVDAKMVALYGYPNGGETTKDTTAQSYDAGDPTPTAGHYTTDSAYGKYVQAQQDYDDALAAANNNDPTNPGTLQNLQTARSNLAAATQALAEAREAYEKADGTGDGKLKININLSDAVTTNGGVADKWQLLPNPVNGGIAYFYYTGILGAGETSSKLIDSVELDKSVTNDMFKRFDFDLNVVLKSAQIAYDADGNVTADATTELDAKAVLPASATTDSAVNWTLK